jgi:hypothetical protein
VSHAAARVERSQRRGGHGCGVPLDQNPVGPLVFEDGLQAREHAGCDVRRRLVVLHEVQVVVRPDLKNTQHLVEHVAVLGRDADAADDAVGVALELADDGSQLYRLRAGAEHREDFHSEL